MDSVGASDQSIKVNARTLSSFLVRVALAAAMAGWVLILWSVPHAGPFWSDQGSVRSALELAVWGAIFFLVTLSVILKRTTEWTFAADDLRRRSWLSRPRSRSVVIMAFGPDAEIVHEFRDRWRVWPSGAAIDVWPGQTAHLIRALERSSVRVDDFRGDWECGHKRLNDFALLLYWGAVAALLATPALGIALGSGLPLTPMLAAGGAIFLGQAIDRLPYKVPAPSAQNV
jgi:hypothetical protein